MVQLWLCSPFVGAEFAFKKKANLHESGQVYNNIWKVEIKLPGEKPALYTYTVPNTKACFETPLVGTENSLEALAVLLSCLPMVPSLCTSCSIPIVLGFFIFVKTMSWIEGED